MAKIMLVEDDNNLREIYEARLLAEGYEIVSAEDGEQALAMAVKEKPDLIISDVMMPKISGFDMLDILRSTPETRDTKVIMMTALSQVEDKTRADKLGADRYLVKSQVTLEDVAKVAKEVLSGESPQAMPAAIAPTPVIAQPVVEPVVTPVAVAPEPVVQPVSTVPSTEPPATSNPTAPEPAATQTTTTADPAVPAPSEPAAVAPPSGPQITTTHAVAEDAAAVNATAQTTDTEEQAVESQIEQFVSSLPKEPPAAAAAPLAAPAPDPTNAAAQDAAQMADAANELLQGTADASPESTNSSQMPGKRVIQPLSDLSLDDKPDLNELLAIEEAKEQALTAATTATTAPAQAPVAAATPTETPASAAPPTPDQPVATTPQPVVETPVVPAPEAPATTGIPPAQADANPDDPNSIAL